MKRDHFVKILTNTELFYKPTCSENVQRNVFIYVCIYIYIYMCMYVYINVFIPKSNQNTFIVTSPQHKCLGEWNSYERAPDSAKKKKMFTYGQYVFTDTQSHISDKSRIPLTEVHQNTWLKLVYIVPVENTPAYFILLIIIFAHSLLSCITWVCLCNHFCACHGSKSPLLQFCVYRTFYHLAHFISPILILNKSPLTEPLCFVMHCYVCLLKTMLIRHF